jgi:hypothetical protein
MQRIVAELYDVVLEGFVVDGLPIEEWSPEFDLECEFTLQCDDGARHKVPGCSFSRNADWQRSTKIFPNRDTPSHVRMCD